MFTANPLTRYFFNQKLTQGQKMSSRTILIGVSALGLVSLGGAGGYFFGGIAAPSSTSLGSRSLPTVDASNQRTILASAPKGAAGNVGQDSATTNKDLLTVQVMQLREGTGQLLEQRFTGLVTPKRTSRLAVKYMGLLQTIHVHVGDSVHAGEVLASLDQRELIAQKNVAMARLKGAQAQLQESIAGPRPQELERAAATVEELRAALKLRMNTAERTQLLLRSSSISQQEHDENLTAVDMTRAQLRGAEQQLAMLVEGTRAEQIENLRATVESLQSEIERIDAMLRDHEIVAPFDGRVQARFVDEGVVVSPGQSVLEVVESTDLEIRVGLPTKLTAAETLETATLKSRLGCAPLIVRRIAPAIDERTRNREVTFGIKSSLNLKHDDIEQGGAPIPELVIGEAVDVTIRVPVSSEGWWVPTAALTPGVRGLWNLYVVKEPGQPEPKPAATSSNSFSSTAKSASLTSDRWLTQIEVRNVEILRSTGDWSQIQGTVNGQDWIITDGVHRVTPGQWVYAEHDLQPR
jgi:HlyD family secretion protein